MSVAAHLDARRQRATVIALAFAGNAYAAQQNLVLPALPVLRRDLDTSTAWVTWVLTALLLTSAASMPIFGRLGDQFGKRRVLMIALAFFLAGSVGAALAPNIWVLILCRGVQGLGGGIFPLCFAIVRDQFPPERVPVAAGIIASTWGIGGTMGLILGGVMLDHVSWRALFVIASIPCALALIAAYAFVPESPSRVRARLDLRGAVLLSLGVVTLLIALTQGNRWGWTSGRVFFLFGAAALILVIWTAAELRTPEPMVDLHMLRQRTVLLLNVYAALSGAVSYVVWVLVPLIVQTPRGLPADVASRVDYGLGGSATTTSLYMLPGFVIGLFAATLGGMFGRRYGGKWQLALFTAMTLGVVAWLTAFHHEGWHIAVGMLLYGTAAPAALGAIGALVVGSVQPTETGVASAMNTVFRTVGAAIGAQLTAAILSTATIAGTSVAAESAFTITFGLAAASAAVSLAAVLAIRVGRSP